MTISVKQLIPVSAPTIVEFYYSDGDVEAFDIIAWALCEDGEGAYVDGIVCEDLGPVTVHEFWDQRSKWQDPELVHMGYKIDQKLINPRDPWHERARPKDSESE